MGSCSSTSEEIQVPHLQAIHNYKHLSNRKHKFNQLEQLPIPETETHCINKNRQKITDFIIENSSINLNTYHDIFQKVAHEDKGFYYDPDFPAIKNSVGQLKQELEILWKRPTKFMQKEYQIFSGGIQPTDIHQGSLGDCYFLSSLIVMSEYPFIVERLFQTVEINEFGIYGIWLCIDGAWTIIIVDDQFPVIENKGQYIPLFAKNHGPQLWVMLLEKAYAKVYGSYKKIVAGYITIALSTLTGAPYDTFDKQQKLKSKKGSKDKSLINSLWQFIKVNYSKKYLLAASSENTSKVELLGIVKGHAYAVLNVKQIKLKKKSTEEKENERLIQLMNPWGHHEFKGQFGYKDKEWTPELKKQLGENDVDNGIFWIKIEDFVDLFDQVDVCKYHKDYLYTFLKVKFSEEANGFKGIYIHVNQKSHGFFTVTQEDHRKFDHGQSYYAIFRIIIVQINNQTNSMERYVNSTMDWNRSRDTSLQLTLQKGYYYVLLQVEWPTDASREVVVSFYGQHGVIFQQNSEIKPFLNSLLDEIIVNAAKTENQKSEKYQEDDLIVKTNGNIAGYIYYYYENQSVKFNTLVETLTLTKAKSVKVLGQPKQNQFTITVSPGQSKIAKLKVGCQNHGKYNYETSINYYLVEQYPLEKIKALCDKKFTKKKQRSIDGKPIQVYIKTHSYNRGLAILYQNKERYVYYEQLTLNIINLELENEKANQQNKLIISIPPQGDKLLLFKIITHGKPYSFKTSTTFELRINQQYF